ncbi:STM4504/CBY_0614 family protein [Myxococcus xanthus]|uniref:Abortive infection protein-like C-terminal domain-containing protein n=1 Tax=Myxococcus xanthus TaxID=34 RepID=A0A7Y4MS31_MYXXA|nr:hypothetical protein [Myxococcus xanthus]NOJ80219.1 hypothetical protein [Myxococcus xanthus]NOJ86304.1 hypothetical protein [Myxococcus xanthus]
MPIYDIFSRREKRAKKAGASDVYQYDTLPREFRVQVIHMWEDAFGESYGPRTSEAAIYKPMNEMLCREYGRFRLSNTLAGQYSYKAACAEFLLNSDTAEALDIIELSFRFLWVELTKNNLLYQLKPETVQDLITELNERFRESCAGYQFESGIIVRIDSTHLHAEAVKPALTLLFEEKFEGADEEFRNGFEHYRHGRYKEALVDALKSFESTMKTICKRKGWDYPSGAPAKQLINVIFEKGLIHQSLQTHFSGLRQTLEAGVPTIRNKLGGHGQGEEPVEVPGYLASYALHLTATNIVMLVEAFKASR